MSESIRTAQQLENELARPVDVFDIPSPVIAKVCDAYHVTPNLVSHIVALALNSWPDAEKGWEWAGDERGMELHLRVPLSRAEP